MWKTISDDPDQEIRFFKSDGTQILRNDDSVEPYNGPSGVNTNAPLLRLATDPDSSAELAPEEEEYDSDTDHPDLP